MLRLLPLLLLCPLARADQAAVLRALANPEDGRVLVCAHRGAHDTVPENSLAAIKRAFDLGCDIVEVDIRQTADGQFVLMHDWTVDRRTDGTGHVHRMTLAQFRRLRLKRATGDPLTQRPPTLVEALALARGRGLLYLDWKGGNPRLLARLLARHQARDQVILSGGPWSLLPMRRIDPAVRLMPRVYLKAQISPQLQLYRPQLLHIYLRDVTAAIRARARRERFRLWINALGDTDKAARARGDAAYQPLLDAGAGAIQTDRPAALVKFLARMGKRGR